MGTATEEFDGIVHQLASRELGQPDPVDQYKSEPLLKALKATGPELWIDTGDLELARSVWRTELTALTTNNTLANQVVQSGAMDDVIRSTVEKLKDAAGSLSREELILEIGFVINCHIALRLVEAFRVKVSVELHPSLARDIGKTLRYARRYYSVCPEYFIVKIPLTPEGYLSVRKLGREGIPINYTLGFSARQNYLAARLSNPDYVNVFLGRLNQVVADNGLGSGEMVGEKVTLSTQRELRQLRAVNPSVRSRLIGASIRNGEQVAALAGLDVLTIPPKAMQDFVDSGRKPDSIKSQVENDPEPGVDLDQMWGAKCSALWEVNDSFRQGIDQLMGAPNLDEMTGEELTGFLESRDVHLFHRFSQAELDSMYDHGKIPKISAWPESVGLDDLMTQSALMSFRKDQDALDARIESFLN